MPHSEAIGTQDGRLSLMALLDLRPGCECCDTDLPPDSPDARICTFECTFCATCADEMDGICKNCGGNIVERPIRPAALLDSNPPSTERVFNPSGCPVHDAAR